MKAIHLFALLVLFSYSFSFAGRVSTGSETKNPDGSVTFREITLNENDETLKVAIDNGKGYASLCHELGFESSLGYGGTGLNTYLSSPETKFVINTDKSLSKSQSLNFIEKVTCFRAEELKTQVSSQKETNTDGSETFTEIKYLRGDKEFPIAMETSYDYLATCRLLGKRAVLYSGLKEKNNSPEAYSKVKLDVTGKFLLISDTQDLITKVTCR